MKPLPLIALAAAFSLSGCATILTGTTEMISVNSDPPGATVTFSHGGQCTTPCNLEVKKKEAIHLTIRKPGCRTHTTSLSLISRMPAALHEIAITEQLNGDHRQFGPRAWHLVFATVPELQQRVAGNQPPSGLSVLSHLLVHWPSLSDSCG